MGGKIGLINAGSFRSDSIEHAGPLTLQTMSAILPFKDQAALVKYTGSALLAVLENSVSQYPLLAGRFLQVSGISFSFDPQLPIGHRIQPSSVCCKTDDCVMEPLDANKTYRVAVKTFIFSGKEGFPPGLDSDIIKVSDTVILDMISTFLVKSKGKSSDGKSPVISPETEGRITCLAPDTELLLAYDSK